VSLPTSSTPKPSGALGLGGPLLQIEALSVRFNDSGGLPGLMRRSGGVRAVDGVDLAVRNSEALGVVGESGSGKTTLALAALGLTRPTGGRVLFGVTDVTKLRGSALRKFRCNAVMIFQDPHSSLSPRMQVASLLMEPYMIHQIPDSSRYSVDELLGMVELPGRLAERYPHELSGGQARRVGIARALALRPSLIVADEPTAGLDVSAASAVLNLLQLLREQHGTAYLIITHALNVVGYLADRIAVMYLGRLVEIGPAEAIYDNPLHPYSQALIDSIPEIGVVRPDRHNVIAGEIPSPRYPPPGCHFHPRCRYAVERCRIDDPVLEEVLPGRSVACHRWEEITSLPSAIPIKEY